MEEKIDSPLAGENPVQELPEIPEIPQEEPQQEPQPQEEPQAETTEEAPEAEAPKTTNDRLRERYPDANPEDDAGWEELRKRYMDDTEATEKEIDDLISSDVDLARVLSDMLVNKQPFRAALAKNIDVASLTPQEGDDDYEAWDKAYNERVAQNKQMVARQQEIDANEVESFDNIDKFCAEKGYDDKTKDAIVDYINEVFDAIVMKKITPELLERMDKARTYDSAVRDAELKGEVKGRNANIEAQRVEEMEHEEGDGIPVPRVSGSSVVQPAEQPKPHSMESFMRGIGENKWMNNR